MGKTRIIGLEKVLANLNREIIKIEGYSAAGLYESMAYILADCDKTPPLIPVDTGNLRASRFIHPPKRGFRGPSVSGGFTANYAAAVHEKVGANFKRPGSGAKFLEASLMRNQKKILEILRKNIKIK